MYKEFKKFVLSAPSDSCRNVNTLIVIVITVDTCTLSLWWCRVVPHGDCSHHPHTHHGETLSLVVMRV